MNADTGRYCMSRRAMLSIATAAAMSVSLGQGSRVHAADLAWRQLPSAGPSARWDHTLVADDETKHLMLFGGRDESFAALDDTWLYDLSAREWRRVEGRGPEPRFGHAVAVDQTARKLYLFGGESASVFYNDAWVFDFESSAWSSIDTSGSDLPTPRYGLGAVLDGQGHLIVSHGFTFDGRFDDTWSLDFATGEWTDVSPEAGALRPLKRCLHEMAWDPKTNSMLLYGGCSSGFGPCPQGDLWRFESDTRTWTDITPPASPLARSNPSLIYDAKGARVILVGGLTDSGFISDIWEGIDDGASFAWSAITATGGAPSARASHDAVLTRGDVYLFGGTGPDGASSDLWKLELS